MTGDIISGIDEIRRLDRGLTKAEMGHGHTAGLFRIIGKICLGIHVGIVANDFNGALVGTHSTIRPQAPEFTLDRAFRGYIKSIPDIQGCMGNIIDNAHGKMIFWFLHLQVIEYRLDHAGIEFLGAEPIAAIDDKGNIRGIFHVRGADILIKGISQGAFFFCPVQNRYPLNCFRDCLEKMLRRKRPIQSHFDQADFPTLVDEVIDNFLDGFTGRGHGDDNVGRIRGADVVKQLIGPACQIAYFCHVLTDDFRQF